MRWALRLVLRATALLAVLTLALLCFASPSASAHRHYLHHRHPGKHATRVARTSRQRSHAELHVYRDAAWVLKKPPPSTQIQESVKERGVNPCNTPDPGWGIYDHWDHHIEMGQMLVPGRGGITRSGAFDVMFHFHGHDAIRKQWVQVMHGAVLVGIDLGTGSGPYAAAFRGPGSFRRLVKSVEHEMARRTHNRRAHVRKVGLSSWSAGYGAIGEILQQDYAKKVVDSVILLDGLHCGYVGRELNARQIQPFIDFAKEAAARRRFMFVSHSSIIPPGYASTTETAHLLIQEVGGRPHRAHARRGDPMGLKLISRFDKGYFHVRGFSGDDRMDHCAHIGLYRDVLKVHIRRRWHSPRGRRTRRKRRTR